MAEGDHITSLNVFAAYCKAGHARNRWRAPRPRPASAPPGSVQGVPFAPGPTAADCFSTPGGAPSALRPRKTLRRCEKNWLSARALARVADVRRQLQSHLQRCQVPLKSAGRDPVPVLRALTAGFFSHAALLAPFGCAPRGARPVPARPAAGLQPPRRPRENKTLTRAPARRLPFARRAQRRRGRRRVPLDPRAGGPADPPWQRALPVQARVRPLRAGGADGPLIHEGRGGGGGGVAGGARAAFLREEESRPAEEVAGGGLGVQVCLGVRSKVTQRGKVTA